MRCSILLPVTAAVLACASVRVSALDAPVASREPIVKAAELGAVRCLVVAPFESGSDVPLASDVATAALVSEIDPSRVGVFPLPELRALFRDTALELPRGIGPSLALELGELLGADAVLYGTVEGRSQEPSPQLLVSVRVSLVSERRLLFAHTVSVSPAAGEPTDAAIREAVVAAARPALVRLGAPGAPRCFDPERIRALQKLALAEDSDGGDARTPSGAPQISSPAASVTPALASSAASPAPFATRLVPRTPRQVEWAKRLGSGERFAVEDVTFAGRSADLQRGAGLVDLAVALFAEPAVSVRLEGFVDATSDPAGDRRLSAAIAQAAAKELADLGIPSQRVTASGRGAECPRLPNFTARGRAANRRIEAVPLR